MVFFDYENLRSEVSDLKIRHLMRDVTLSIEEDELENIKSKGDLEVALDQAISDIIIWNEDKWAIMDYYQTPEDANLYKALDEFKSDIINYFLKIK